MMTCDHCGFGSPHGDYCARCGSHHASAAPVTRLHSFAAHPTEHVGLPAIFSTLLPHAAHGRSARFHTFLTVGVALVGVLWAVGLVSVAFVAAALLVPVLYLLALYRAEIYEAEPLQSVALACAAGMLIGTVVTLVAQRLITPSDGATVGSLLVLIVALPLVQELLKTIPALALRHRPGHSGTVDGLTLGVASGLGFAFAEAVVTFVPVIRSIGFRVEPSNWLVPLLNAALLVPLLQASCAGLLTAVLWRALRGHMGPLERASLVIAPVAHMVFAGLAQVTVGGHAMEAVITIAQATVVAGLLVCVRGLLHAALLDEAALLGLVAESDCPHCHGPLPSGSAFCPRCGAAARRGRPTVSHDGGTIPPQARPPRPIEGHT